MKIYLLCPVTRATEEQKKEMDEYVANLEKEGHKVHYPPRDVNQDEETGYDLYMKHKYAMKESDRVDIFWDKTSRGSIGDLGMAIMAEKPIKLVKAFYDDEEGKTFLKIIKILDQQRKDKELKSNVIPKKYFKWIYAVSLLLNVNGADLIDDPNWFGCYDDGMTPEEAVAEYKAFNSINGIKE